MIYKQGTDLNFVDIYDVKCNHCSCEFFTTQDKIITNFYDNGYSHIHFKNFTQTTKDTRVEKGIYCENCGRLIKNGIFTSGYSFVSRVRPEEVNAKLKELCEKKKENENNIDYIDEEKLGARALCVAICFIGLALGATLLLCALIQH